MSLFLVRTVSKFEMAYLVEAETEKTAQSYIKSVCAGVNHEYELCQRHVGEYVVDTDIVTESPMELLPVVQRIDPTVTAEILTKSVIAVPADFKVSSSPDVDSY